MTKAKNWTELRNLWQSLTQIPRNEQGIILLEQFILGYEEGLKELTMKDEKIRLLKKALTRMIAEFDTTTPVIPNQLQALKYANNLIQSNDE